MAQIAEWADDIKYLKEWQHTRPWHYVNIKKGYTYTYSKKNPNGDVIVAINKLSKMLQDKKQSTKVRAEALKYLVHFVGDIHQPLHTGYLKDKGGTQIEVIWKNKNTNLHKIWDYKLIAREKLSFSEYANFLDHPTKKEIKKWSKFTPELWAEEGQEALDKVYEIVTDRSLVKGKKRESRYAYRVMPLLNKRLLQAGIRLAHLLNISFK